ncbi:M23 family metallopeptidase [Cohnella nanjingensis]|uniref:Peptidoglycan DD-metalloendopeptidase family protein n=1 Tax=Cohnella nanjingensis TaxID=1387779 RepID=A0A7X0RR46_9BACL|nr:M23 family metallopeptidase [Cohnella nanjingensis]MBB6672162.1 peptidoglycan DD-metalloendopeptidase family protein [Cohnella nanjingensis]
MRRTAMLVALVMLLSGCAAGGGSKPSASSASGTAPSGTTAPETASPETSAPPQTSDRIEGSAIGQALLDGETDRLYDQMSGEMQKAITREDFKKTVPDFVQGIKKLELQTKLPLNESEYYGWVEAGGERAVIAILDRAGTITSLQLTESKLHPETDNVFTKLAYRLPFEGEWYPFWAGEDVLSNYHYAVDSQRYASDLIVVKDGYSYRGDAKKNESYYAYGQKIKAAADGTVVHVVNDIVDNEPVGAVTTDQPAGNVVVIDHGNGEFSYLAHLRKGSVQVKVGDKVKAGDWIGLCGNSGNSSEPHLHFQVSDKADLFEGKSIRVKWEGDLKLHQGTPVKSGG